MRILITGAGEVGFLVASELYEDHDVTVIDKDIAACTRLSEMDVRALQGNAANAQLLIDAGVKDADIVLAVTGSDEVNIITCIIAGHMGVKQTIARVSNPEYIDQPVKHRKQIGISYMICPELVMAEELARTLYFPSMLMNRQLSGGKVELIEFKASKDMPLIGRVEDAVLPDSCKIIAINRAGDISLPQRGVNDILPNDHVILICDSHALTDLRSMLHEEASSHKVMIVGGGMVGFYLASRLEKMGFDLKLIEIDPQRCRCIADDLSNTMILNGDGTDISLLKEEGAGDMDVIFAVTGVDEKNLLCSLLARQLGAKKIISRVNKSAYIKLFELVGVDRAVSPGQVTGDGVLQLVIGGEEVITLSDERIELVDFAAKKGAKIIGKNIVKELPEDSVVGMVLRSGKSIVPGEDCRVEEGDRVFILALHPAISKVKKLFAS
jgi:trk system potassium uptake protein TrkA